MKNVIEWIKKPAVWITALVACAIGGIIALVFRSK